MSRQRAARLLLRWGLAVAALGLVTWAVPVRDRCWDARAKASTHVSVSRDANGCVLHLRSGEVSIDPASCAQLTCEPGLASAVTGANLGVIAALLALYGISTLAWAARWRALLGFAGIDAPLGRVWRVSIEAQAAGVLLPGGIGGDALRIASVASWSRAGGEGGSALPIAVASVALDRIVGLSVLAAAAAAMASAYAAAPGAAAPTAALALIPLSFVLGLVAVRRVPEARLRWVSEGRVGKFLRPVLAYARDPAAPRAIVTAAALSVLVAAAQFLTIRGLVYALGATPTREKWVYLGVVMVFIVSALPGLPGGWGTADAAYVVFLGLAGIGAGTALAVCLWYRLFWYVSAVAGAILNVVGARSDRAVARAGRAADPPA